MKTIIVYITFLLFILLPHVAQGEITGCVVDETSQPICYAHVIAFNNDSIAIETTCTTENGLFSLKVDNVSSINISAFGYKSCQIGDCHRENLGEIKLLSSSIELREVTVSASQPVIKLSGGEIVTNVQGTYLSQLGTANDVLRWIPTVSGSDGKFNVFGKGSPAIYINGRRISDYTELEQLSSSNIQNISVISNPSAKYDASIKSVIVIRTRKAIGEGFGIKARVKNSFSYYYQPLGQLDITYRSGGLDLSLVGYASNERIKNESNFTQNTYLSSIIKQTLSQTTINNQSNYIGKFTVNYQINPQHSIGAFYRLSLTDGSNKYNNNGGISKDAIQLDNLKTIGYDNKDLNYSHSRNLYYNGSIDALDLDFNLDYYSTAPEINSQQHEYSENQAYRIITSNSKTSSKLLAQKVIAAYNLKSSRIEIGEEFTNSDLNMVYDNRENILLNNWSKIKENHLAFFLNIVK